VLRVPGPLHRAVPPMNRAALPVEKTLSVFQGPASGNPVLVQGEYKLDKMHGRGGVRQLPSLSWGYFCG